MYRRQFLSLITLFQVFFIFIQTFLNKLMYIIITKSTRRPNKLVFNSHGIVISYLFLYRTGTLWTVFLHASLCSTIFPNSKLICSQSFCIETTIFMQRHTILTQPYVFIFFLFASSFFSVHFLSLPSSSSSLSLFFLHLSCYISSCMERNACAFLQRAVILPSALKDCIVQVVASYSSSAT